MQSKQLPLSGFIWSVDWIKQGCVVVADVADAVAHWPGAHWVCGIGMQEVCGRRCFLMRIEPAVVVLALDNDRHTVVNRDQPLVGGGGENRESFQRIAVGLAPASP